MLILKEIKLDEKQKTVDPISSPRPISIPWLDPKEKDLTSDDFNAVWECIKSWDINVPEVYEGYCGATGNHVIAILLALGKKGISQ